jgi:hypothetical protein
MVTVGCVYDVDGLDNFGGRGHRWNRRRRVEGRLFQQAADLPQRTYFFSYTRLNNGGYPLILAQTHSGE